MHAKYDKLIVNLCNDDPSMASMYTRGAKYEEELGKLILVSLKVQAKPYHQIMKQQNYLSHSLNPGLLSKYGNIRNRGIQCFGKSRSSKRKLCSKN